MARRRVQRAHVGRSAKAHRAYTSIRERLARASATVERREGVTFDLPGEAITLEVVAGAALDPADPSPPDPGREADRLALEKQLDATLRKLQLCRQQVRRGSAALDRAADACQDLSSTYRVASRERVAWA